MAMASGVYELLKANKILVRHFSDPLLKHGAAHLHRHPGRDGNDAQGVAAELMADPVDAQLFQQQLLTWYDRCGRDLPWRRTRDPYRIWLSEVMLQQTGVQGGYSVF